MTGALAAGRFLFVIALGLASAKLNVMKFASSESLCPTTEKLESRFARLIDLESGFEHGDKVGSAPERD